MATKLPEITNAFLDELADRCQALAFDLRTLSARVRQDIGLPPDTGAPLDLARDFARLAEAAAEAASLVLLQQAFAANEARIAATPSPASEERR